MPSDSYLGPKQHALVLVCLFAGGLALAWAPNALLGMQYQCVLHRLTGIRCPFCGMTRDFILMAHGSLPQHNPGSLLLAIALYGAYPVWLASAALCGSAGLFVSRERTIRVLIVAMAALLISNNLVA
jgi:hypothetical protein